MEICAKVQNIYCFTRQRDTHTEREDGRWSIAINLLLEIESTGTDLISHAFYQFVSQNKLWGYVKDTQFNSSSSSGSAVSVPRQQSLSLSDDGGGNSNSTMRMFQKRALTHSLKCMMNAMEYYFGTVHSNKQGLDSVDTTKSTSNSTRASSSGSGSDSKRSDSALKDQPKMSVGKPSIAVQTRELSHDKKGQALDYDGDKESDNNVNMSAADIDMHDMCRGYNARFVEINATTADGDGDGSSGGSSSSSKSSGQLTPASAILGLSSQVGRLISGGSSKQTTATATSTATSTIIDNTKGFYHHYRKQFLFDSTLAVYFPGTSGFRVSKHTMTVHIPMHRLISKALNFAAMGGLDVSVGLRYLLREAPREALIMLADMPLRCLSFVSQVKSGTCLTVTRPLYIHI